MFTLRYAMVFVFSHGSHRTAVNAMWPLLVVVTGPVHTPFLLSRDSISDRVPGTPP